MSLETFTQQVREAVGDSSGLDATVKFAFEDGTCIYIDGKSTPNTVDNDDREAQCTVRLSLETFAALMSRSLNPMAAFMQGKFKIDGDMGVAMRMQKVFGG